MIEEARRSGLNTLSRLHLAFLRRTRKASQQRFRSAKISEPGRPQTVSQGWNCERLQTLPAEATCIIQHADPRLGEQTPLKETRAADEVLYGGNSRGNFRRSNSHSVQAQDEWSRKTVGSLSKESSYLEELEYKEPEHQSCLTPKQTYKYYSRGTGSSDNEIHSERHITTGCDALQDASSWYAVPVSSNVSRKIQFQPRTAQQWITSC